MWLDGGTASWSTDYSFVPRHFEFPGQYARQPTSRSTVIDDIKDESDETVILKLTSPTPVTIPLGIPGFTTTLTILMMICAPGVKFSNATETAGEADGVKAGDSGT